MGATVDKIKKALEASSTLKLSVDGTAVTRVLPTIPPLRTRQLLLTLDKKANHSDDGLVVFIPLVLSFPVTSEIFFKTRDFEKKIPKLFLAEVPYCKISKKQGVVVFNEKEADLDAIDDFVAQEHSVEKVTLKFTKLNPEETFQWFKNNRQSLEDSLKKRYSYRLARQNSEPGPAQLTIDDNYGPIELGGRKFCDFRETKNYFKGVLARTRNGEKVGEEETAVVKALLSHHSNAEEKLRDFVGISVNSNPEYPTTRCFFIERHGGDSEDFSYHKCLTHMYNELLKNK